MEKYFFLDRGIIQPQGTRNFAFRAIKAVKDHEHNPMFGEGIFESPSKPWEVRYDNSYPNVLYDPQEKLYRVYYTIVIQDEETASIPLEKRNTTRRRGTGSVTLACGYAQSEDGIHWIKPSLGVVEFEGSRDNNIILLHAHGTGVFLDEQENNPEKRYKLVARMDCSGQSSFMAVSFSRDGIHWQEPIRWPEHNPKADSHNYVFRDQNDQKFKLITRLWSNGMRVSAMCESDDFIHWSETIEVLRGIGYEYQVYSMPVFQWDHLYLGLASIFHEGDRDAEDFDHLDVELTYATTTSKFDFAAFGDPIIPRGEGVYHNGDFDCGVIFASPPVILDDKVYVYYMGGNGQHTEFRETALGRAYFEKDKWVALKPKVVGKIAEVMTSPFSFSGNRLEILADNFEDLEVALYSHYRDLEPIEGFAFHDSTIEKADNGYVRVSFAREFTSLEGKNVCIVIRTKTASLYTIRGEFTLNCGRL